MLKCKDIAEHTSDYLDPNLNWHKKLGWHLHLFMCGPCRRFVHQFQLSIQVSAKMAKQPISIKDANEIAKYTETRCRHEPTAK